MTPFRGIDVGEIGRRSAHFCRVVSLSARRLRSDFGVWGDIRSLFPLAILCGLNCVGVMIVVRRFFGPSALRISAGRLGVLASVAAALALIARILLARAEPQAPSRWLRALAGFACALPLVALATTVNARIGLAGLAYVAALIAGSFAVGMKWNRRVADRLLSAAVSPPNRRPGHLDAAGLQPLWQQGGPAGPIPVESPYHGSLLRLERVVLPAGEELIQGIATVQFAAVQETAALHVAFCPPLACIPEVTCSTEISEAIRVKTSGAYPWGCRFELKRRGDLSTSRSVTVQFRVVARPESKAAA
ncbi:MAG: hypothetical protein ACT4QC_02240 [Planctomycetaceae bacterium]